MNWLVDDSVDQKKMPTKYFIELNIHQCTTCLKRSKYELNFLFKKKKMKN